VHALTSSGGQGWRVPVTPGFAASSCSVASSSAWTSGAEWQPPHRIDGLCPAPLMTEAADTRIFIGLEGRGNSGLSYRLGPVHVFIHEGCPPLRHTPHCQAYRTEAARRAGIAGSRCSCSVTSRSAAAHPRTSPSSPRLRACAGASTLSRADTLLFADPLRPVNRGYTKIPAKAAIEFRRKDSHIYLLSAPLTIPLVYCHINSFRRASSCGEPMARRRK
jgi:hypothetical protein